MKLTKPDLIKEINFLIKETHNNQDKLDLHTFNLNELNVILTELKEN